MRKDSLELRVTKGEYVVERPKKLILVFLLITIFLFIGLMSCCILLCAFVLMGKRASGLWWWQGLASNSKEPSHIVTDAGVEILEL